MATFANIGQRRNRAAELVEVRGFVSLAELVNELEISESTARRDLEALEAQGLLTRTHGGAVCKRYTTPQRLDFGDRETSMAAEKQAIARRAAQLVQDDQIVILNGGTTCSSVASALVGRRISAVTNSVPIASLLSTDFATEVTLIGGYLYPRTGVALGVEAQRQLSVLRASLLIMGCGGLGPDGIFNINQIMVDMDRAMMGAADRVALVVDHTKFDRGGLARICNVEDVDIIITDDRVSKRHLEWLSSLHCEVMIAGNESLEMRR